MAGGHKRKQQEEPSVTGRDGTGKRRKADGISSSSSSNTVIVPGYHVPKLSTATVNGDLPELPRITDLALEKRVFTHQGSLDHANCHRADLSYERLEFLGDAYIECICTRVIYDRYPHLPVGKLSHIRESLVNNAALSEHAKRYGFHKRIDMTHLEKIKGIKIYADIFEAYVAAIIIQSPESGFNTAEKWLSELWIPRLKQWDKEVASLPITSSTTTNTTAGDHHTLTSSISCHQAKQDLATKLLGKNIRLEFIDERPPDLTSEKGRQTFFIGAYLTGWGYERQHLGSGTGSSKQEASQRAALHALTENRALVETIAAKKMAFDERVRAQREKETEGKMV